MLICGDLIPGPGADFGAGLAVRVWGLLLGSAAALAVASRAHGADETVVPEPEPAEYLEICDVDDTGFYYVPGTEICLQVGGYYRYDIGYGRLFGEISDTGDETWDKRARFQLRLDAQTETELGTLRGYSAINFQWETGTKDGRSAASDSDGDGIVDEMVATSDYNASVSAEIEETYVELGGFRIGMTDSLFTTVTFYASNVLQDGLIPYGPYSTHQIAYTFDAGNGFTASAAVEEGSDDENYGSIIDDYAPLAVAGAAWSNDTFGASVVAGWDSAEGEFAVKGRVDLTPGEMIALLAMGAWSDDGDGSSGNYYAQWGGDWALWAGGTVTFNDRVAANMEFGYNELGDWSLDGDVGVTVVPGFDVTPGVGYTHTDDSDDDQWGGYLRTQFSF
jgi:hypothetical protein